MSYERDGAEYASYGAYLRAKNLAITDCRSATNPRHDRTVGKAWNASLDAYAAARRQGIQPDSTKRRDTERAVKISNETGQAYGAS